MKVSNPRSIIKTLAKFPIFSHSTSIQLNNVTYYLYERTYKKGQILFTEGDPRERIYLLTKGYIKLERTDRSATSSYGDYLKPHSLFPYSGMFKDKDYHYTAIALTDVELFYIPTNYFEKLVQQNNQQMLHIINELSLIVEHHEKRLLNTTNSHASERVKHALTYLMNELGEPDHTGVTITCPLTTTDVAKLAGTSRETVSHVINDYKKEGLLTFKNKGFHFNEPRYFV